ncbi:MAG: CBS domain-containing protein, partial [Elusimicrobia bacterium]|nr:CBS domain-containing protein [Elusimicrobiota bacterium]
MMEQKYVKDLMLPLDKYAVVHENATLYDAVTALNESHAKLSKGEHLH